MGGRMLFNPKDETEIVTEVLKVITVVYEIRPENLRKRTEFLHAHTVFRYCTDPYDSFRPLSLMASKAFAISQINCTSVPLFFELIFFMKQT
jgi:hypothetical protein